MTYREYMQHSLGYDCITTFWEDFSIADRFGEDAIRDTFSRAFDEWKSDYRFLTELVLVLNHKCWFHHNKNNDISMLYEELCHIAARYAEDNLHGDEAQYYFDITD